MGSPSCRRDRDGIFFLERLRWYLPLEGEAVIVSSSSEMVSSS